MYVIVLTQIQNFSLFFLLPVVEYLSTEFDYIITELIGC